MPTHKSRSSRLNSSKKLVLELEQINNTCFNLFPLLHLPQSKPSAITSNLSYPTAAKMCSNSFSYPLHLGVRMSSHSWQWRLHPWTCSRPASQVLHTNATLNSFYPVLSGSFLLSAYFSLLFFFFCFDISSSVLIARG